jgi:Domain of unknown function (DUF4214)/Divergent InlB B-repeat domain
MRIALLSAVLVVLVLGPTAAAGPQQEGTYTLKVQITGSGQVTSSPGGINCPGTCSFNFKTGSIVSLSKNPNTGWSFAGWSGDCSGSGGCSVAMRSNQNVTATFVLKPKTQFTLSVTVSGNGSVASSPAGIACPGTCSATYDDGTVVTLAPLAGAGAVFGSWGGACSGAGVCVVTMNADRSASAAFNDRRTPPPETRPAPDTGKPDRGTSGPPFKLVLPFTCFPANDLWLDKVYRDALKRPVDQAALDFFGAKLKGGASRADVALSVLQSVEYRTRLVQGWYQTFLKRLPSGPELASWLGLLGSASEETVESQILGSSEYFANRGGGTDDGFVGALFQDLLGRPPAAAELTAFKTLLAQGTPRPQLALNVLQSKEGRTKFVQGYFQPLLGRSPTPAEIDSLVTRTGQAILVAILASDEYFAAAAKYAASIHWGDGSTSPGTIQQSGDRCTVVGTHSYSSNGKRTLTVDVTSPDGTETPLTRALTIVPPPPPPPGKENVRPSGKVFIKKGGNFVPLTGFDQVPLGTELDTRKGKVELTSPDGSTGDFYGGIFKLGADKERRTTFIVIVLTGGNFAGCQSYKRTLSAAGKAKPPSKSIRHVWGNAKGHFRTKGKYASATVRGTLWLTNDVCGGTWVHVRRGVVDVYDFVLRKHIFTHAGRSYLAKPKSKK